MEHTKSSDESPWGGTMSEASLARRWLELPILEAENGRGRASASGESPVTPLLPDPQQRSTRRYAEDRYHLPAWEDVWRRYSSLAWIALFLLAEIVVGVLLANLALR